MFALLYYGSGLGNSVVRKSGFQFLPGEGKQNIILFNLQGGK